MAIQQIPIAKETTSQEILQTIQSSFPNGSILSVQRKIQNNKLRYEQLDKSLPFLVEYGTMCTYNNQIHVINRYDHWAYSNEKWVLIDNLPIKTSESTHYKYSVVYNGKIHVFFYTYHYTWDGTSWESVSTLPVVIGSGNGYVNVYNNEIHIFPSGTSHYVYNEEESTWTSSTTVPYTSSYAQCVIFDGALHILGGGSSHYTKHYKYDGTSWTSVSTLPVDSSIKTAFVFDNKIHIVSSSSPYKHYIFNESSWTEDGDVVLDISTTNTLYNDKIYFVGRNSSYLFASYDNSGFSSIGFYMPNNNQYTNGLFVLDHELHLLCDGTTAETNHYKYVDNGFEKIGITPYKFDTSSKVVVLNNEAHILGGNLTTNKKFHYKYSNGQWIKLNDVSFDFSHGFAYTFKNKIYIIANNSSSPYLWNEKSDTWSNNFSVSKGNSGVSIDNYYLESNKSSIIETNDGLYFLGLKNRSGTTSDYKYVYYWNGAKELFESKDDMPEAFSGGNFSFCQNNKLYMLGFPNDRGYIFTDKLNFLDNIPIKYNSYTCVIKDEDSFVVIGRYNNSFSVYRFFETEDIIYNLPSGAKIYCNKEIYPYRKNVTETDYGFQVDTTGEVVLTGKVAAKDFGVISIYQ